MNIPCEKIERRSLLSRVGLIAGGLFAGSALSGRPADAQTRTSLSSLQAEIDSLKSQISDLQASAAEEMLPVGSIIGMHTGSASTPLPPGSWVDCSGQILNDSASVYHGETLPNLNGSTVIAGGLLTGTQAVSALSGSTSVDGTHAHSVDPPSAVTGTESAGHTHG